MDLSSPQNAMDMAKSLQSWWALAGVDTHYSDEPASLLEAAPQDETVPVKLIPDINPSPAGKSEPQPTPVSDVPDDYPDNLTEFVNWLSNPENLIEAQWARNFVRPLIVVDPVLLVITGMPEPEATESSALSHETLKLLSRMLIASGYDEKECLIVPISLARSPDGQIEDKAAVHLKARAEHLMKICGNANALILGDTAARVLFSKDLLHARGKKLFINHVSSKTEAVVTFHPRSLLQRPELKGQAWKDLQMILRTSDQ